MVHALAKVRFLVACSVALAAQEWGDVQVRPDLWLRVHICSNDPTLPVVVFMSGGLGTPLMSYWEEPATMLCEDFNVVAAEQRGVLPFNGTATSASVAEHLDDTVALIHYARRRFAQDKVYLSSISFGSNMAHNLTRSHPELFHAVSLTAPIVYFPEIHEDHVQASVHFCKTFKERLPWYWSPLRLWMQPCEPDPDADPNAVPTANYWRDIFFISQLAVPLCVMMYCEDPPKWDIGGPNIFKMLREPWYGVSWTAWIGLSNVNYDITNNHFADLGVDLTEPVAVPVQIIAAEQDMLMVPKLMAHAHKVVAAPQKKIDWVGESGHMVHIEQPRAWATAHVRLHAWASSPRCDAP